MLENETFKKSSYSGITCVEVGLLSDGTVAVQNTKSDMKPHVYTQDEWVAFIKGVKDGEFDYPDLVVQST